jgi:hypothetical protein
MRVSHVVALTAALVLAGPASAARKKSDREPAISGPTACTRGYCRPIPPGCHTEPEMLPDGVPSGYDVIVCPHSR